MSYQDDPKFTPRFRDHLQFIQTPHYLSLSLEERRKAERDRAEQWRKAENEACKEKEAERTKERGDYLEEAKCCRAKERRQALKWSFIVGSLCTLLLGLTWSAAAGFFLGPIAAWWLYAELRDMQKKERQEAFLRRYGYYPPSEYWRKPHHAGTV